VVVLLRLRPLHHIPHSIIILWRQVRRALRDFHLPTFLSIRLNPGCLSLLRVRVLLRPLHCNSTCCKMPILLLRSSAHRHPTGNHPLRCLSGQNLRPAFIDLYPSIAKVHRAHQARQAETHNRDLSTLTKYGNVATLWINGLCRFPMMSSYRSQYPTNGLPLNKQVHNLCPPKTYPLRHPVHLIGILGMASPPNDRCRQRIHLPDTRCSHRKADGWASIKSPLYTSSTTVTINDPLAMTCLVSTALRGHTLLRSTLLITHVDPHTTYNTQIT